MDTELVDRTCKEATKEAFEGFKIQVSNSVFPLDEDVIAIELHDMKQTIGQKVLGKLMDPNLSKAQMKVLEGILKKYQDIAVKVGKNYAKKLIGR